MTATAFVCSDPGLPPLEAQLENALSLIAARSSTIAQLSSDLALLRSVVDSNLSPPSCITLNYKNDEPLHNVGTNLHKLSLSWGEAMQQFLDRRLPLEMEKFQSGSAFHDVRRSGFEVRLDGLQQALNTKFDVSIACFNDKLILAVSTSVEACSNQLKEVST
jgi:hypothetical protein